VVEGVAVGLLEKLKNEIEKLKNGTGDRIGHVERGRD